RRHTRFSRDWSSDVCSSDLDQALAKKIDDRCAEMGLPSVSVLEPVLTVFQSYLGTPAGRRVGAQHVLDADYFRRIDALNFTMERSEERRVGNERRHRRDDDA